MQTDKEGLYEQNDIKYMVAEAKIKPGIRNNLWSFITNTYYR